MLYEVRRTLQAARESTAASHLLAYSNTPDRHTLAAWIKGGVIGTVREVHNWTDRPFWPQGMQEYHASGPAVPDGFNWALWQGPEPDRPYHPSYTFAVYRGWYAYGTGCLGDMGHYSLWQPYRILDLGVPECVEGRPNNEAWVDDRNVSTGGRVSLVAFPQVQHRPLASSRDGGAAGGRHVLVRRRHEAADARGDVRRRRGSRPTRACCIIGDKGKILCDFRANAPRLLPRSRHQAFVGSVTAPDFDTTLAEDEWVNAIRSGTKSKGSFEQVAALAEAVTLASIALRVPYKRLIWDAARMEFTNAPEANVHVRREQYREGWRLSSPDGPPRSLASGGAGDGRSKAVDRTAVQRSEKHQSAVGSAEGHAGEVLHASCPGSGRDDPAASRQRRTRVRRRPHDPD